MTNEELVESIQKGINVQENMQQLYDQNRGLIFQWIRPYTRIAETEDLMQEAFFGMRPIGSGRPCHGIVTTVDR